MKLIAIAGTNGSGKDTVGETLAAKGWLFVSVTDMLRDEARKRGWPVERKELREISAEWRQAHGLGVLVDRAVEVYEQSDGSHAGLVLSSLRNPGEADRLHELGGQLVWVDGDPKVRYKRIYNRRRSAEDQKTFKQFLAEEKAEMDQGGAETALHMAAVKAKADVFLENNGSDRKAFKKAALKALNL